MSKIGQEIIEGLESLQGGVKSMTARQTTFKILKGYKKGETFTGYDLRNTVRYHTGKMLYPATALRYLRIYRKESGRRIVNIDKAKSVYQMVD